MKRSLFGELVASMLCVSVISQAGAGQAPPPVPDDLQIVPTDSLPAQATWLSLQLWGQYPPSPFNWCAGRDDVFYYSSASLGTNRIVIDDRTVDYSTGPCMMTASSGPPMPPGDGGGGAGGGTNLWISPQYGSGDIWLSITNLHTNYFGVALHGVTNHYRSYWQLLTNPAVTLRPWGFGEIQTNSGATNILYYQPIPNDKPMNFFWAAGGDNIAQIASATDATEPDSGGSGGLDGNFVVFLTDQNTTDVTVWYSMSGTALPGLDYSNYPGTFDPANRIGSVTIAANTQGATVNVHPLYDTNIDFDEPAFFTLILTNDYVVYPSNFQATVFIRDNNGTSNFFSIVATNLPSPVGIDYSPAKQAFLLPINYDNGNDPTFGILDTNATLTTWSALAGVNAGYEVRLATAKVTTNGLATGDMLFGNGSPGGIGWVSADGSSNMLNWATITNEPNLIQGLYVDQTGVWSNDVLAVSGADTSLSTTNLNIWRIHLRTNIQLVASISCQHLEGLLTVPTNSSYGPIAGTLLTGDENLGVIYSVDTNGVVTPYSLGILPDEFRLVPAANDLYCVSFDGVDSQLLKISQTSLTNYVGGVMIEQSGETGPLVPELFFVNWAGTNFAVHGVRLSNGHFFEKSAFAPISLPPIP